MKRLASWLLLALASAVAPAQLAPGIEQKLDEVFKPWDKKDAPGGAVSVSVKGEVVYRKAFGMANLETGTPITTETVFDVGSVSKQFTATCVMLLQDEGKVKIDEQASLYLPEYPVLAEHKITVRQLMQHTAGLRDYLALLVFKSGKFSFEDDEVVEVLQGQRTLDFAPGTSWSYSNSGYYLLKKIVEKLSGKSLAEFAKERIFTPLGMSHTQYLDDASRLIPGRAFGYVEAAGNFHAGLTIVAADGAGGVWTTLDDMHKWTQNWKRNRLGSDPDMFKQMQTAAKIGGRDLPYGLAFFVDEFKGIKRIQHGGDYIGFHAQVCWYPEQDVLVTTMSNDGTQNAKTLNDKAAEIVLGEAIKQPASAANQEIALDEKVLDDYIGVYDLAGRLVEVTRDGAQLKVQVTGQPKLEVYASEKDKFFYKVVEARLEFVRNAEGKVESLTIFQGGATIKCPRSQPFEIPDEQMQALVGHYYSTELDALVRLFTKDGKLYAESSTLLDDSELVPTAPNKFSAGPLLLDVETKDRAVLALRITMSRATQMRFIRLSSDPSS